MQHLLLSCTISISGSIRHGKSFSILYLKNNFYPWLYSLLKAVFFTIISLFLTFPQTRGVFALDVSLLESITEIYCEAVWEFYQLNIEFTAWTPGFRKYHVIFFLKELSNHINVFLIFIKHFKQVDLMITSFLLHHFSVSIRAFCDS